MRKFNWIRKALTLCLAIAIAFGVLYFPAVVNDAFAENGEPKSIVKGIMSQGLSDLKGRSAKIVSVTYPPGGASKPHRHPAHVFVYVLEGTVEAQLDNGTLKTYKAGQSWYEPPMVLHKVSRNASKTEPAKVLAFIVIEDGKPVVIPEKK